MVFRNNYASALRNSVVRIDCSLARADVLNRLRLLMAALRQPQGSLGLDGWGVPKVLINFLLSFPIQGHDGGSTRSFLCSNHGRVDASWSVYPDRNRDSIPIPAGLDALSDQVPRRRQQSLLDKKKPDLDLQ